MIMLNLLTGLIMDSMVEMHDRLAARRAPAGGDALNELGDIGKRNAELRRPVSGSSGL